MVQKAGSISGFPSNDADLYTALVQHRYRKHISPIKFSDHNPSSKCSNSLRYFSKTVRLINFLRQYRVFKLYRTSVYLRQPV